jgi:hypothetical protein
MEPGPTCQSHTPPNCLRRSPACATPCTMTQQSCHWWPPPHVEWSLPIRVLPPEGLVSHFLLPRVVPSLLCFALLCTSSAHHGQPLPSLSKLRKMLTIVASSSSTELELEPLAIDTGWASSPRRLLLPRGSPLTTTVRAPLASPPLQEEPLEYVVWPCLHLHRRWPPVRAIVHPPSSSLTAARPLCWAPFYPTATHRFPLVRSSSPAPPCLASHHRPVRIDWWGRTGEGGIESPVFTLGPKGQGGSGPLRSSWAEPL